MNEVWTDEPNPGVGGAATHVICVLLPIRAVSLNQGKGEHWAAKARRAKAQRQAAHWKLKGNPVYLPCVVTLTRIAPSVGLDPHDNLPGGLKATADGVADWLGIDDRDPSVTWRYCQERGREYGVRVTVESEVG